MRTAAGGFTLGEAHTLAELEALDASQRQALLLPADRPVAHLPAVQLDAADAVALCQGRSIAHWQRMLDSLAVCSTRTSSSAWPMRMRAT